MFSINWTDQAARDYALIRAAARPRPGRGQKPRGKTSKQKSSKAAGLLGQVAKTIHLLAADPRHPGLQTHAYTSLEHPFEHGGKVFEAYAQNKTPGAYRVFWCYGPARGQIAIIAIAPHP